MEGKPDLVKVMRHYGVEVQEYRVSQLVCCPVHSEDRPSCSVNTVKQLWSCKACGAQGDSYTLIQTKEGLSFREAIEFARDRLGVAITPDRPQRGRRGGGYRPKLKRAGLRD
jgi:DNA primase